MNDGEVEGNVQIQYQLLALLNVVYQSGGVGGGGVEGRGGLVLIKVEILERLVKR